jgi:hypothetical protein
MLPITTKLAFHGRRFGSEVENPSCNETAENWYVGYDDGYVVLDVVDTVVDWICPVRVEQCVKSVAVRKVDFCSTDCSNTVEKLVDLFKQHIDKAYARLQVKTTSTTRRDLSRALIILRTMMKGIGRIRTSVSRFAQVTQINISPILCLPMQCNPPKVLGFQVLPVKGGQMNM